jgi:hypothetical protein
MQATLWKMEGILKANKPGMHGQMKYWPNLARLAKRWVAVVNPRSNPVSAFQEQ